eukprot:TRINITY_DN26257_c0_g1_i1.p1 TRINITY_DN26257_c0_g1~~TRINITY_DN26257_c0_g1_i1.p1  ORF type:complete len:168 (+),score=46.81 TRINITY_DN26257_c0_g1_i1:38-505(+)
MAKVVVPSHFKWQRNYYQRSACPLLRYMNKLDVRYYQFSPNKANMLEFVKIATSRKQTPYVEKNFKYTLTHVPFGQRASIDIEYRNGDKLALDTENMTIKEMLDRLRMKRLDLENHLEWFLVSTHVTLEEEAAMGGGADVKKKDDKKKKKKAKLF